jgi:hypothetical protein
MPISQTALDVSRHDEQCCVVLGAQNDGESLLVDYHCRYLAPGAGQVEGSGGGSSG